MKNNQVVLVVILILVAVAGVLFFVTSDKKTKTEVKVTQDSIQKPSSESADEAIPSTGESESAMNETGSNYVSFSPQALSQSIDTRRVLFFYANWCPTCKPVNDSFTTNIAQIPSDITVIRVNYNDSETDQAEKDLAQKYSVTYQHTFVQIDTDGNEVTRWNGGSLDELLERVK